VTFKDEVKAELACLFRNGAKLLREVNGNNGEAFVIVHAGNLGLQVARDRDSVILINLFPASAPEQKWPVDYILWNAKKIREIPLRLANRSLHEWSQELVMLYDQINEAFSPTKLPETAAEISRIEREHEKRFMAEFKKDPTNFFRSSSNW